MSKSNSRVLNHHPLAFSDLALRVLLDNVVLMGSPDPRVAAVGDRVTLLRRVPRPRQAGRPRQQRRPAPQERHRGRE
jgi:hypothetical protein